MTTVFAIMTAFDGHDEEFLLRQLLDYNAQFRRIAVFSGLMLVLSVYMTGSSFNITSVPALTTSILFLTSTLSAMLTTGLALNGTGYISDVRVLFKAHSRMEPGFYSNALSTLHNQWVYVLIPLGVTSIIFLSSIAVLLWHYVDRAANIGAGHLWPLVFIPGSVAFSSVIILISLAAYYQSKRPG